MSLLVSPDLSQFDERTCRVCGCTDFEQCPGGCDWVGPEDDLCTRCDGRYPNDSPACVYCGALDCARMGGLLLCTQPQIWEGD